MRALPHRYVISAAAAPNGEVALTGQSLPPLRSRPPAEFGGPGDRWSPETLVVAAVAESQPSRRGDLLAGTRTATDRIERLVRVHQGIWNRSGPDRNARHR